MAHNYYCSCGFLLIFNEKENKYTCSNPLCPGLNIPNYLKEPKTPKFTTRFSSFCIDVPTVEGQEDALIEVDIDYFREFAHIHPHKTLKQKDFGFVSSDKTDSHTLNKWRAVGEGIIQATELIKEQLKIKDNE